MLKYHKKFSNNSEADQEEIHFKRPITGEELRRLILRGGLAQVMTQRDLARFREWCTRETERILAEWDRGDHSKQTKRELYRGLWILRCIFPPDQKGTAAWLRYFKKRFPLPPEN